MAISERDRGRLAIVEAVVPGGPWSLEKFWSKKHPALQIVENTGRISWLGVRDDFRNWFVRSAA